MVLVAALCEDQSSAVAHAVAPGRCYELGIAYVVFAMWVAGELSTAAPAAGLRLCGAPSSWAVSVGCMWCFNLLEHNTYHSHPCASKKCIVAGWVP